METLFNTEFYEIDIQTLSDSLKFSTVGDMEAEHAIIDSIYNSQSELRKLLYTCDCFVENIRKYSSDEISLRTEQLTLFEKIPIVSSSKFTIGDSDTSNLLGLMKRSDLTSSYSKYFWRFGAVVQLTNNITSVDTIPIGTDLLSTDEMLKFYFLENKSGEVLFACRGIVISDAVGLDAILSDRVLTASDSKRFFFRKDQSIPTTGRTIIVSGDKINQSTVSAGTIFTRKGSIAKKIFARGGAITLKNMRLDFLNYDNPVIDNNSSLDDGASTNTVSSFAVAKALQDKKAPFTNWESVDLKKGDSKSGQFKSDFVSLLLSGNSIPADKTDEYLSLVSKNELLDILEILGVEIANMDVCDDN